jgi:hypothetical protein
MSHLFYEIESYCFLELGAESLHVECKSMIMQYVSPNRAAPLRELDCFSEQTIAQRWGSDPR